MVRTQVQLTEEQYEWLRRLAREENISMAELIRRALDYFEELTTSRSREAAWERANRVVGAFRSGKSDVAERHDDYFADSILP